MTTTTTPNIAPQIEPIENHPSYAFMKLLSDGAVHCAEYDLEASRWVAGLLVTIMQNTDRL
jgi:hypothetical protein